jgi:uncharacterized protein YdiU (UPF0061 family)
METATSKSPQIPSSAGWRLEHSYAELPDLFHVATAPQPVAAPQLLVLNRTLAASLGLDPDELATKAGVAILAGNALPPGAEPLAQAYAGHQFGGFTQLGDGRAILLGEQVTPGGGRFDIQLKGSGRTPFSRGGDGRAAVGPMLREFLISEAMHALGIPTTRSLAVAATGESVLRQDGPLPGAILTRVAASHLRVGTFEWATAAGGPEALRSLATYTLQRHYPEQIDAENPALALLASVIERQASLLARWMSVGFIHGVMNTDNMAISGETIDYGPCAFMDAYNPATVFSSIDRHGRYAYANQPAIAQWNLARFAEALLPLIDPQEPRAIELASASLEHFAELYQSEWLSAMRRKLGIFNEESDDHELIEELLAWMYAVQADFTNTFAALSNPNEALTCAIPCDDRWRAWEGKWRSRLSRQPQGVEESIQLRRVANPAIIPRNHHVEAALAAAHDGDLSILERLLAALRAPYANDETAECYRQPDPKGGIGYRTYCGT